MYADIKTQHPDPARFISLSLASRFFFLNLEFCWSAYSVFIPNSYLPLGRGIKIKMNKALQVLGITEIVMSLSSEPCVVSSGREAAKCEQPQPCQTDEYRSAGSWFPYTPWLVVWEPFCWNEAVIALYPHDSPIPMTDRYKEHCWTAHSKLDWSTDK